MPGEAFVGIGGHGNQQDAQAGPSREAPAAHGSGQGGNRDDDQIWTYEPCHAGDREHMDVDFDGKGTRL